MALSEQDRIDITDLINQHGHRTDAGELDELCELFTPDVTYDVSDFGFGALHGAQAIRAAALTLGEANPVGHHVTNIVITGLDDGSARVRSKGIGVLADGTSGSVTYDDVVTRRPDGWKISHRKVLARRTPLGGRDDGRDDGPRAVLDRWRAAVVSQSIEELADLYAPDAVHEFPFTRPGLPARLEGRDEIMAWVAQGWQGGAFKYDRYRTLAIHDTADPHTIVVEQDALGTSAATGEFALPNIVVLTVRDGRIVRLRDYVNILAAMAVIGS
ncbi:nuclear transport factor 2 family protein [Labedaea rhizosphaerae]|uniref:Ketosteroid isomerase-like protein n=1 Tax=Labedaea rhizosphaerae TaxID=598644 RepID=A0A4R6RSW6_LABRH|nr:nuclear transport factor 2 family protein [Labedaea rhizosphaerae]TDP89920.1 ketosteroid isomerase-like protein [Labedaea rhizosphaerae]